MKNFFLKLKYNWKRVLAIAFLSLAVAFEVAYFIYGIVTNIVYGVSGVSSLSFIWSFAVMMYCYLLMYSGNVKNSYKAYRGVLLFVFMSIFLYAVNLIILLIESFIYLIVWETIVVALLTAAMLVLSIFCYRRLRGYISGRPYSLKSIYILFGFFFGLLILAKGFNLFTYFSLLSYVDAKIVILALLEPLADFFATIGAWITIGRLSE